MTLVFQNDNIEGPRTHAFVIGVGSYPHAKQGKGHLQELRGVDDLPSAADSAKFVCEWLLTNGSRLAAPLASLEVLISDVPAEEDADDRYKWTPRDPIDRAIPIIDGATETNVLAAGNSWWDRLSARPGDSAFFYCCGHGANHATQPVLFLEDLNLLARNPWSHLGVGSLAQALRRNQLIGSAFLFVDACGEFLSKFELGQALECRFFPAPVSFKGTRNNVSLICAASETGFAYDGEDLISSMAGSSVRLGRFTQVLVKALGGASARYVDNRWAVEPTTLAVSLRKIQRIFFDAWEERSFEPVVFVSPTDIYPISYGGVNFEVPIVILIDPLHRMKNCELFVSEQDDPDPYIRRRAPGPAGAWLITVPATRRSLFAIARHDGQQHSNVFTPEPLLKHLVVVQ